MNIIKGISIAVKSAGNYLIQPEKLRDRDFKIKFYFELVPNHEGVYKLCTFADYAPSVFDQIRQLYNIKHKDYLASIGSDSFF